MNFQSDMVNKYIQTYATWLDSDFS
jgi:hypothetical protein